MKNSSGPSKQPLPGDWALADLYARSALRKRPMTAYEVCQVVHEKIACRGITWHRLLRRIQYMVGTDPEVLHSLSPKQKKRFREDTHESTASLDILSQDVHARYPGIQEDVIRTILEDVFC